MACSPRHGAAEGVEEALAPNMKQGACLLFAHGLNVHYGMISPREDWT